MMRRAVPVLAMVAAVLAPSSLPAAGSADAGTSAPLARGEGGLHRNPFERPTMASAPTPEVSQAVTAPPPWTPLLKATMVAPHGRSLANVDGELLHTGEAYQGYTLVEVREREAVFERDGHRWVLSLD